MRNRRDKKENPIKKNINNQSDVNTEIKIPYYAPNAGITPKEYYISPMLLSLEEEFEARCKKFIKEASPDRDNGSYMDCVIQMFENEAIDRIKVQREDHIRVISNPINNMHKGDKIRCTRKLNDYREELRNKLEELELLRKIYYRGTIYEQYIGGVSNDR